MPRARHAAMAGAHHHLLLAAEQTVLARVRVQARDGNPRRGNAESRQLARRQRDGRLERLARQRPRHLGERMWIVASTTRSASE